MSRGKQRILLNVAAVIGVVVSMFVLPGGTPFWLWATVAALFLVAMNIYLSLKHVPAVGKAGGSTRTMIIVLGFTILIIDLVLGRFFR